MLYELNWEDKSLAPLPFQSMEALEGVEKDLENILARNLQQTLFEKEPLLVLFQERPYQSVGDIYALNRDGDLVIFELKKGEAGGGALNQLFTYVAEAASWNYDELHRRWRKYRSSEGAAEGTLDTGPENADAALGEHHQAVFGLDGPLQAHEFNRKQRMVIVGHAAARTLRDQVQYWREQSLDVDFMPYRVYRIGDRDLLEFFTKPFDSHANPAHAKGVLFDTNRSYEPSRHACLRHMVERSRVSAWGTSRDAVRIFNRGDLVFYYHTGWGVVGAARVRDGAVKEDYSCGMEELYLNVDWLTPPPDLEEDIPVCIPARQLKKMMNHGFYFARIEKRPRLDREEAEMLLEELEELFESRQ